MDKELNYVVKSVLVKETNSFLDEIDRLMKEDGVEKAIRIGRTQIKTIMDGVNKAASVEELFLFISYQESKRNGWDMPCDNKKSVAQNVIDSIRKIMDEMQSEIQTAWDVLETGKELDEEDIRILRLNIAEKYMGYLYWQTTIITKRR